MCFARFMDLALHDARDGYYARAGRIGSGGDFVTASDAGRDFGRALGRFLCAFDRSAGPFSPFDVVEFGAGRGLLARDILDALPAIDAGLAGRARYTAVEPSAAMREIAARTAPEARVLAGPPSGEGRRGCVVAVELFDALGVHRLQRRGGRLLERRVGLDGDGALVERDGPPCPGVEEIAERHGAAAEEGGQAEVSTRAGAVLEAMARSLEIGALAIVDYGDLAPRLFASHPSGTALAYRGHATSPDLLADPGAQDLTAHVNFSQLEHEAGLLGLRPLAFTTLERFLLGHGILESFRPPPGERRHDPVLVKRRLQALHLIHPAAMGRRFKVQVFWKGDPEVPAPRWEMEPPRV